MAAPSVLFFLLLGVTTSFCRTTTQTPKTCEYGGQFYKPGESFNPSSCESCHCDFTGQAHCAIVDCARPQCVDAIKKPDQCCPVCPNGPTCSTHDDVIIKLGETVTQSDGSICSCVMADWGIYGSCHLPKTTVTTK